LACRHRPRAQALDGDEHIRLLHLHGVADLLGPVGMLTQRLQRLRERHERLHGGVPRLILQGGRQGRTLERAIAILGEPLVGLRDLQGIGARHEHLREQFVRIERDRRQHGLKLVSREPAGGRLLGGGGRRIARGGFRGVWRTAADDDGCGDCPAKEGPHHC
jgi:hypothetical protein